MRLNIGFPVVRTDGRAVYGHVITKFSGMGRAEHSGEGGRESQSYLVGLDLAVSPNNWRTP